MGQFIHPCQRCGACCTAYQVIFHLNETLKENHSVPIELTYQVSSQTLAMKHKEPGHYRCVALQGNVGRAVGCRIYQNRPSPCRNFKASFEDGIRNPRCDECRIARGLQPLTLMDWQVVPEVESIPLL